jgi:hypothetical protein
MPTPFDAAADWPDVLDALQAHVECAERLLIHDPAHPLPAWVAPVGAGELPAEHLDRATELLDRLSALMSRVERAAGAVHHEMDFVRAATAAAPAARSIFVDTNL